MNPPTFAEKVLTARTNSGASNDAVALHDREASYESDDSSTTSEPDACTPKSDASSTTFEPDSSSSAAPGRIASIRICRILSKYKSQLRKQYGMEKFETMWAIMHQAVYIEADDATIFDEDANMISDGNGASAIFGGLGESPVLFSATFLFSAHIHGTVSGTTTECLVDGSGVTVDLAFWSAYAELFGKEPVSPRRLFTVSDPVVLVVDRTPSAIYAA